MAPLQAGLSQEFLQHFITETLYLVEGEAVQHAPDVPASTMVENEPVAPADQPARRVPQELPKIPQPEAVPQKFNLTGENHKGVAVLVTLPDEDFRQLPQLDFLQKILTAIGLQAGDVAYVNNVSGELAQFEDLVQALQVDYIISFATRIETQLPHDKFTLYSPVRIGKVPVIFSHALASLKDNVDYKKQLWAALKQVFI